MWAHRIRIGGPGDAAGAGCRGCAPGGPARPGRPARRRRRSGRRCSRRRRPPHRRPVPGWRRARWVPAPRRYRHRRSGPGTGGWSVNVAGGDPPSSDAPSPPPGVVRTSATVRSTGPRPAPTGTAAGRRGVPGAAVGACRSVTRAASATTDPATTWSESPGGAPDPAAGAAAAPDAVPPDPAPPEPGPVRVRRAGPGPGPVVSVPGPRAGRPAPAADVPGPAARGSADVPAGQPAVVQVEQQPPNGPSARSPASSRR